MRLLDFCKRKDYPEGGASMGINFAWMFNEAMSTGEMKEVELDDEEMTGFFRAFSEKIPMEVPAGVEDFYFWGIHIKRLNRN